MIWSGKEIKISDHCSIYVPYEDEKNGKEEKSLGWSHFLMNVPRRRNRFGDPHPTIFMCVLANDEKDFQKSTNKEY